VNTLVIDASIAIKWVVEEHRTPEALALRQKAKLIAPNCWSPSANLAHRTLLDWSQQDLSDQARVGIVTVRQLEGGLTQPRRATASSSSRRTVKVPACAFGSPNADLD